MNRFRWWRKLRGGDWVRVTGYFWGYRWVKVPPEVFKHPDGVWESYARVGKGNVAP